MLPNLLDLDVWDAHDVWKVELFRNVLLVYNKLLPPLMLLNEKDHGQLLSELKSLGFIPESKMVA